MKSPSLWDRGQSSRVCLPCACPLMSPLWDSASSSGVSPWGAVGILCGMILDCPGHCREFHIPGHQPLNASSVRFVTVRIPNIPTHFQMARWGWFRSGTVLGKASVFLSGKWPRKVPQSWSGFPAGAATGHPGWKKGLSVSLPCSHPSPARIYLIYGGSTK